MNESWSQENECQADMFTKPNDKLFRFIAHGLLLNTVGALGLIGNALSLIVLSQPQMRSSTDRLLAGLAAADSALILSSVLLFGLSGIYPYTGYLRYYYLVLCPALTPYVFPVALVAQTTSVYLTLLVTIERWVAVCHPLRARSLCTPARARWVIAATAMFSLAYNTPKFFEVEVRRSTDVNGEEFLCVTAAPFRTSLYVTIYVHWMYLIVMYAIPFTMLAVLNMHIVCQVWRAQAERARLSRVERRELGLATMLLVVVLVFFVCNLPPLVTNAVEVFLTDEFEYLDPLVKIGNLLVTINSSVNFIIYVVFGEKFKRVFLKIFCWHRDKNRSKIGVDWQETGRGGRDSPDNTRDDSCGSCERLSLHTSASRSSRRGARLSTIAVPVAVVSPLSQTITSTTTLLEEYVPKQQDTQL